MQIQTPDWVKNAIFYQIFPDRFVRGTPPDPFLVNTLPFEEWDAPPTLQGYKGGNLWGVIEQLDYLRDLGITAIYFTPVFQSACNHRYHTHDYYQVDPLLGGNAALRALVDEAHARNIKVVLDGVFNHASRGFYFFNDILENGSYSPWLDWFKIQGWPLSPYDGDRPANYASWIGNRALPQFNHENPVVREYIMRIGEFWIDFGIDGWRLDVPNEVKVEGFWQEFRDRIKAVNPDAYIVGEIWEDATPWLDGTQFDGVMNYLFTSATIAFAAGDRVDRKQVEHLSYNPFPALKATQYAEKMQHLLTLYPWDIQLTQLNLLDSHDTARMLTIAQGDAASVHLATLLLMTFPGAPSIYYGDEVGLPGSIDPDSRRGFPVNHQWNQEVLNYHRQLIALRHAHPALRLGEYQVLFADEDVYVFARVLSDEVLVVAVNIGTQPQTVQISDLANQYPHKPQHLLYGTGAIQWQDCDVKLTLPARQGMVFS